MSVSIIRLELVFKAEYRLPSSRIIPERSARCTLRLRFCVSVLRNSSMVLINSRRRSAAPCISDILRPCLAGIDGSHFKSSNGPIISVSGVRSSWVILVKKRIRSAVSSCCRRVLRRSRVRSYSSFIRFL